MPRQDWQDKRAVDQCRTMASQNAMAIQIAYKQPKTKKLANHSTK